MSSDAPVVAYLESRAGEQMGKLIERLGARALHAPALAEEPDVDLDQLRAWIEQWSRERDVLVIFQTGVGVEALDAALERLGLAAPFRDLLAQATVAVRGPKPTAALRKRQVRMDLAAASPYTSETLLQALSGVPLAGRRVYVQRHGGQNPELMEALRARGAQVTEITVYRWSLPADTAPLDQLLDSLRQGGVSAVVFTSASQIHNLMAHARVRGRQLACAADLNRVDVLSVGPVCTEALRQAGITVTAEASPPKLGPLMDLIGARLRARNLI